MVLTFRQVKVNNFCIRSIDSVFLTRHFFENIISALAKTFWTLTRFNTKVRRGDYNTYDLSMHNNNIRYRYQIEYANSPFWALAIHDGHEIDEPLLAYLNLTESERLREEDPHTAAIAALPVNRLVVSTSRFQLDINRDKENAVYLRPEQAWGLSVWRDDLPPSFVQQLYQHHDHLYGIMDRLIERTVQQYGYFVVYDVHSYNAKRSGPHEAIDQVGNPQIILGTLHNHDKWHGLARAFIKSVEQQASSKPIDIRENVKFGGGNLSKYINRKYGDYGCVLSIEFRKDNFMDEWTGEVYPNKLIFCKHLLQNTVPTLMHYFSDGK